GPEEWTARGAGWRGGVQGGRPTTAARRPEAYTVSRGRLVSSASASGAFRVSRAFTWSRRIIAPAPQPVPPWDPGYRSARRRAAASASAGGPNRADRSPPPAGAPPAGEPVRPARHRG